MRLLSFSQRTWKEIIRDPLTAGFGIGFPVILLLILSAIQANIPVSLFEIQKLTPGIAVFGLSFCTLFSAMLISKDRETAFFQRLYATPMKAVDFIAGYTLPVLLLAVIQSAVCYGVGMILGFRPSLHLFAAFGGNLLVALFFISLGLLFGSFLSSNQVGGLCGALLTNLTAFLSGIWFDPETVGGFFEGLAKALPFFHGVKLEEALASGIYTDCPGHFLVVLADTLLSAILSVVIFLRQMKKV